MKNKMNSPYPLIHPNPCVLIGTIKNESINFTTIGDIAVAGLNPALIMISLHEHHLACEYIVSSKKFSINIPTDNMVSKVDYCGVYSGRKVDKSKLFDYTLKDGVPLINECPVSLIAKVEHSHQIMQRVVLICSIESTYVSDNLFNNKKLDFSKMGGLVYGLDNKFYSLGNIIGEGYESFKKV
jgi:flavin reductase (DIM6/NTAB) family NADH-FMN oxidoreductase RutF